MSERPRGRRRVAWGAGGSATGTPGAFPAMKLTRLRVWLWTWQAMSVIWLLSKAIKWVCMDLL